MNSPANTIVFCEQNDYNPTFGEAQGESLSELGAGGAYSASVGRHSGGLNFAMGDGHCEWVKVEDFCRNCPTGHPVWWDSDTGGDWSTLHPPPYHWWFAEGISTEGN